MQIGCESHEKDQDAIECHPPLKEELGAKPWGQSSPDGSSEWGNHIGGPEDHSRPYHGLLGSKSTEFENIKRDKCQDAVEGESHAKLGNREEKNSFIFKS